MIVSREPAIARCISSAADGGVDMQRVEQIDDVAGVVVNGRGIGLLTSYSGRGTGLPMSPSVRGTGLLGSWEDLSHWVIEAAELWRDDAPALLRERELPL